MCGCGVLEFPSLGVELVGRCQMFTDSTCQEFVGGSRLPRRPNLIKHIMIGQTPKLSTKPTSRVRLALVIGSDQFQQA